MKNLKRTQQGGFLQIIFGIVILIIVVRLMGFTVGGFFAWIGEILRSAF
ncbi:MAG: hypothetical protein KBD55_00010 [Candidatus Pacebacteria bacterium]|jgi:hypothetical protein|nr:hypothetical protein [Candidatus Paceibacterota bacterium]